LSEPKLTKNCRADKEEEDGKKRPLSFPSQNFCVILGKGNETSRYPLAGSLDGLRACLEALERE
jgi:hypothetical protein